MTASLASIARVLGGEVTGRQVLCPGPGHSVRDRSISVTLSPDAPDGLLVHSFGKTDPLVAKDFVRARLGLPAFRTSGKRKGTKAPSPLWRPAPLVAPDRQAHAPQVPADDTNAKRRLEAARRIAEEIVPWQGTLAEQYLRKQRHLDPDSRVADLGFHRSCPWRDTDGRLIHVPAMIGVMRSAATGEIVAVHRTRLSPEGRKVSRRMLGVASGAAIMLARIESIDGGLTIGEGIETCLAAWQLGWRNCWALGSAGAIASFPVLPGTQCLSILCEDDDTNRRATDAVGTRYASAGREVILIRARGGGDMNDVIARENARCA